MNFQVFRNLTIITGILICLTLNAAEFQIDFSSKATNPGSNWNVITNLNTTKTNLIDFGTGLATSTSVTAAGWQGQTSQSSGTAGGFDPQKDWVVPLASQDFFLKSNTEATVTFTGLPADIYSVEIISSYDTAFTSNSVTDILVEGTSTNVNFDGTPGVDSLGFDSDADGFIAGNWLIWDNVTAVGGEINISFDPTSGFAVLNAIRIEGANAAVPEPGTYVMFATILFSAIFMRLRSSRKEENVVDAR